MERLMRLAFYTAYLAAIFALMAADPIGNRLRERQSMRSTWHPVVMPEHLEHNISGCMKKITIIDGSWSQDYCVMPR